MPGAEGLTAAGLMAEAARRAGREDWGGEAFVEPLELLIESCAATARLTPSGWAVLHSVLLRHLRNRLHLRAHLEEHPEAALRPLGAPVVVTGLPRTGTSLLHGLLAQDPRLRPLRLWEALHPVPPGEGGPDEELLVAKAERWLERFYALAPGFRAVHPLTARGPEECDALLQNAFASLHFDDMFDARGYSRWLRRAPLDAAYADYALQLRVLGGAGGEGERRWLLKSPGHLGHLDALLRVLPRATVVHCHRDPAEAVPSYASLILTVRGPHTERLSPAVAGDQALERAATAMERALDVRAAAGEERFADVSHPALAADPIGTVAALYSRLGLELDGAAEGAMRAWLAAHPRHLHGVHRYDPAAFGLGPGRVRAAFTAYRARFGELTAA